MATDPATKADDIGQHLLVLRCQAGDERAFRDLYGKFGGRSLRYLAGLAGDDAAEDIQQEVWLAVYRRIGSLADPARFPTWLLAAARNRAIDWLRRRKRERVLFDEGTADISPTQPPSSDPRQPSFDDANVRTAMSSLPAAHREVLMLRYRDELSYSEIALVVGCPIGTVRSRLHNARSGLEQLLGQTPESTDSERHNLKR